MLVIGAKHELGEKAYLITVFSFGFHLVGKCSAEIFQPLTVLPTVKQYFVHHDKQLACPVGIELAAEVLVGVERNIVLEDNFQKVQKRTFTRISLFGHKQKNW